MERSHAAGWAPLEPLHADLVAYEAARRVLGDAAMDGAAGPALSWPAEWGAWALAEHRMLVARHFAELERIASEEAGRR